MTAIAITAAQAPYDATGGRIPPHFQADHDRDVAAARAQLDDTAWQTASAEGPAMSLEQATAYALEDTALPDEVAPRPSVVQPDIPPVATTPRAVR